MLVQNTVYCEICLGSILIIVYVCSFIGCFVDGLYLEGAGWDRENSCLVRQNPKQLIEELPVLKIIPIEAHRLKLQVCIVARSL